MAELVTRYDLGAARSDLENRIAAVRADLDVLRSDIANVRRELEGAIERQSLRQTVRTGVMLAASIAVLATIIQLS